MALRRRTSANPEGRMTLREHLLELRRRILVSSVALVLAAIAGWYLFDPIYAHLVAPIRAIAEERGQGALITLNYSGLMTAFSQRLSIALWAGTILSAPVWLYQVWAFVVPGLTTKERRTSRMFMAATIPLFLAGCWYGYVTLPKAVQILLSFTPQGAANLPQADLYFTFVTRFILVFGLAALFPVFLIALNVLGALSAETMLKGWRVAVVLIFVFAAVATPTPDPFSMFLLAGPLVLLYFSAYAVARLLDRRRRRDRPDWADLPEDSASPL